VSLDGSLSGSVKKIIRKGIASSIGIATLSDVQAINLDCFEGVTRVTYKIFVHGFIVFSSDGSMNRINYSFLCFCVIFYKTTGGQIYMKYPTVFSFSVILLFISLSCPPSAPPERLYKALIFSLPIFEA